MLEIRINKNYNLSRLQKWLDYEIAGTGLLIMSYFFAPAFFVGVVAAILFTPLLITVLVKEKRYGWLVAFFVMVVGAAFAAINFVSGADWLSSVSINIIGFFAGLMGFYVYCVILRLVIPGWYHQEDMGAS